MQMMSHRFCRTHGNKQSSPLSSHCINNNGMPMEPLKSSTNGEGNDGNNLSHTMLVRLLSADRKSGDRLCQPSQIR